MSIARKNIAVAGAGIMGLMTAFTLQEAGHSVTIFDPKGFPADNASSKAGGMLAPFAEIEHMPDDYLKPCFESIRIWEALSLQDDFEFARQGSLLLAHAQDRHMLDRFAQHAPQARAVNRDEIVHLEPALSGRFTAGLYLAEEAHLHPRKTMRFLSEKLQQKSQQVFDIEKHNKDYDFIVDCRGMDADNDSDLRGVKGEMLIVHNPELSLTRPVRLMHPRYSLYIVPRAGNIYMIGATNIESAGDSRPSVKSSMELMSALVTLHPSFAEAGVMEITAGIRPSYPDNLPRITRAGNIMRCNGLYRHGFLLSPVMAGCVLALVENRENPYISYFMKGDRHEGHHQRGSKGLHSAA